MPLWKLKRIINRISEGSTIKVRVNGVLVDIEHVEVDVELDKDEVSLQSTVTILHVS